MAVIDNFDITANFWKIYPQFKISFGNLYSKDKSKDKTDSSKIMWAIALFADNSKTNIYRNLSLQERMNLIAEDYLKNPKFDWRSVDNEIELYKKLNLTKNQRNLLDIEDKLDQRTTVLKNTSYNIDNA